MSSRLPLLLPVLAALAFPAPAAESDDNRATEPATSTPVCRALGTASDYNAVFFGDFVAASSDVEGRIAVQGKLDLNNYSLGDKLTAATAGTSVIVGGDLVFPSGRIYHGNTLVAGSAAGVGAPVRNGLVSGQTIVDRTTLPIDFVSEKQRLIAYSNTLAALPANGTVSSQHGGLYLSGTGTSALQVFALDGRTVLDAHTFQVSNIPAGATVLFNISGTTAGLTDMSLDSLSQIRRKVLFNFPAATTLQLAGIGVEGSILAPNAVFGNPQGVVKGSVIGKSWNGQMQLNHEPFEGCGLPALPPPSCELYPIAISASSVANAQLDQAFTNIVSGAGPGQFGWLTWAGSPSAPTLANSLTPPGDSHTYRNPDNSSDTVLNPPDWVQGSPGQSNSSAMRAALDALLNREISVPAWAQTRGQGNNFDYQVSRFIRIKLAGYELKGNGNKLSFVYRGAASCAANAAPVITSTAVTTGSVSVAYSYDVNATDADGDPLTYALVTKPSGMTINATSGLIAWTPGASQTGAQAVLVRVTDGRGGSVDQSFTITVSAANRAPSITSTAVTTATVGLAYSYDVNATDADGDPLTYALPTNPSGMTINATSGLIAWTPGASQTGTQAVVVRVTDGGGGSVDQNFSITVSAANRAPVISSTPVVSATNGIAYSYDVNATDPDGDPLVYALTTKPTGMTINASTGLVDWTPSSSQVGSHSVTVRVTDDENATTDQTWTITVAQSNRAPTITSTAVTSATNGIAYNYDLEATDPDGDTLTYALSTKPAGMSISSITGLINWTPTEAQVGPHTVTARVTDEDGATVDQTWTITVAQANRAPTIGSTPVTSATNGIAYSYDVEATDPDGDTLTYALTTKPAGMTINASTGRITWTPTEAQVGPHTVTARVSDEDGATVDQTWTITVAQSNRAPTIGSTPVTSATNGIAYSYDVNATDPDGDTLTYSLTDKPTGMSISPTTGLINWTPTEAQVGPHSVTARVTDEDGATVDQTWTITVAQANRAPTINSTPVTSATNGIAYSYDVEATDPDGDTLTYSLTTKPTGMTISSTTGLITWTPSESQVGPHTVTARVTDEDGASVDQTWTITVAQANRAPSITSTAVTSATNGVVYSYDVDATDPDGDSLTYSLTTKPAGMTISSTTGLINWTPTQAQVGPHTVTARVTDEDGASVDQTWTITVAQANRAPTITSTAVTSATNGIAYSYDVDATDPDGDTLTYSLTTKPTGMTINASTGLINWTPTESQVGPHSVTARVTDEDGATVDQTWTITVAQANRAPTIGSTPVTSATNGVAYSYDVDATDPDGDTLTYSLTTKPTGMSISPTTGLITWTPTEAQVGPHSVTARVTDEDGATVDQTWIITVAQSNRAPTIGSTPVTSATNGIAYSYDVDANDPDGDTLSYALTTKPAGMSISSTTGLISWTPTETQVGPHTVTVRVTDEDGATVDQTWTITVAQSNRAPTITSTAVTSATSGIAYSYDVNATDPDGDILTYSLTNKPTGMSISSTTGLITWTPIEAQVGPHTVTARVTDEDGATVDQTWTITVAQANRAPSIGSTPVTSATNGSAYSYDVEATDPDGDTLTYSLTDKPTGMSISPTTGLITWTPTEAQVGPHAVTARVTDEDGATVDQTWTITVAQANRAPTIGSTPVTSATNGVAYSYDVDATDPDGDTLTYSLTTKPTGMSISPTTGLINWTPTEAQVGPHTVSAHVTDEDGATVDQTWTITVAQANRAPTIGSTPITSATNGSAYSYDVNATDPDGDTLSYSLTDNPTGMTISSTTGLITWTPAEAQVGPYTVTARVTDEDGATVDQTWTITVAQSNRAPTITSTAVTSATTEAAYSYDVNATDPDGDTLNYSLTTMPTGMSISSTTGLISWTPTESQVGPHTVTARVTDEDGATVDQTWTITVAQSNRAPTIGSTPVTGATNGIAYSYDLEATDPDGDTLTYSLTTKPTGMTISSTTGLITWTPTESQVGPHTVTARVTDEDGATVDQTWTITVAQANRAPSITSTAVTSATTEAAYSYDVDATDPDGDTLTYSLTDKPSGMSINATTGLINWTPVAAQVGIHPVKVEVSDGQGGASTQLYSLTVTQANRAPTALDGSLAATANQPTALLLRGSDPDGDALTYSVTTPPAHGSLSGTAPNLTYTASSGYSGPDQLQFRVNDGQLDSTVATVSITVASGNRAPIANPVTITVAEDSTATITLTGTDPDGDPLNFEVLSQPAHGVLSGSGASRQYQPQADFHGSDSFEFRVNDGLLNSAAATVSLIITPVNDAPRFTSTPGSTVAQDQTFTYEMSAADPDGTTAFTWTLLEGPNGARIDNNGVLRWLAVESSRDPVAFRVRVNDGDGGSDQQQFQVQVNSTLVDASDLGRQFWFGLQDNSTRFGSDGHAVNAPERRMYVVISGPQSTSGTVEIPGLAFSQAFSHTAGAATEVNLPASVMHLGHATIKDLGVFVNAALPVQVTVHNYDQFSGDSFRALPLQALGTQYTVLDQHSFLYVYSAGLFDRTEFSGQFQIVATEDGTSIMLTPRAGAALGINGFTFDQPYTLTLNRGQALYLSDAADPDTSNVIGQLMPDIEYTGTRIQASKPIALMAGNTCAYVSDNGNACNHLVEQLLPDQSLGVDHLTISFASRLNGDRYRIVATQNQTLVRIDGVLVAQLAAGEHLERVLTAGAHRIEANWPISVAHFGHSHSFDQQIVAPIGKLGDPTMVVVPSRELWLKTVFFSTPAAHGSTGQYGFRRQHASVIVPTVALASLRLDGQPVSLLNPIPVAGGEWTGGTLNLLPGAHVLSADQPIGVELYGWDEFDAYGFNGGIGVAETSSASITVTPAEQTVSVGTKICVAARALDATGAAIPFARISVSKAVEGQRTPPTFAHALIADANGRSEYCAYGQLVQTERWSFNSGNANEVARVIWNAPDRNLAPLITSTPQLVLEGGAYAHTVTAIDPNGDAVLFDLQLAPAGMSINAQTGQITWTPAIPADRKPTRHLVTVRARDPGGLEDLQRYELEVRYGPYLYVPNTDVMAVNPNLGANGIVVQDLSYGWRRANRTGGVFTGFSSFGGRRFTTQSRMVEGAPGMTYTAGPDDNYWSFNWPLGSINPARFGSTEARYRMCRLNNGELPSLDSRTVWGVNTSANFPVFAALTDSNADGAVNTADRFDAIGLTTSNQLHAIDLRTGATLWLTPTSSVNRVVMPAAGDLNGDGASEIVAVDNASRKPVAYDRSGTRIWTSAAVLPTYLQGAPATSAVIADLNADGQPEVVIGPLVLDRNGVELWRFPNRAPLLNGAYILPVVADIEGDGRLEVLYGEQVRDANGALVLDLRQKLGLTTEITGAFAVGNLDADAALEIVMVHFVNDARASIGHAFDSNGTVLFGPIALGEQSQALIADMDGDGNEEVEFVSERKRYSASGVQLSVGADDYSFHGELMDLDGDGSLEMMNAGFGYVDPIDGSQIIANGTNPQQFLQLGSKHLIDFDHDGEGEIFDSNGNISLLRAEIGQWQAPAFNPSHYTDMTRDRSNFGLRMAPVVTANNLPDLWVSPPQIDRGVPGTVWTNVRNRGSRMIDQPVTVQIWQGAPEQGGTLLGSTTISNLPIGALQRVEVTVNSDQVRGWLEAHASIQGNPAECFTNNQAASSHHINLETWDAPGPDRMDVYRYLLEIWDKNQDPSNIPTPVVRTIAAGETLVYQSPATDSNIGDALSFYIDSSNAPVGMTIHPHTGEVRWTPTAAQVGTITNIRLSHKDLFGRVNSTGLTVTVTASANRAPVITSTAVLPGAINQPYSYDVEATDPNGDVLTYALTSSPTGMTIDSATGLIQWTPTAAGSYSVTVRVSDPGGLSTTQTWSITVTAALNRHPVITSVPPLNGRMYAWYYYNVDAEDPDGQTLTYTMTLLEPRVTVWSSSINSSTGQSSMYVHSAGPQRVRVRASDGQLFAEQEFTINFAPDTAVFGVEINLPSDGFVAPNTQVPVSLYVSGGNGTATRTLTVDGVPVVLDANGAATINSGAPGTRTLVATVTDLNGTTTTTRALYVGDPADTDAPVVELPADWSGRKVTAPIAVTARVEDSRLAYWRLILQEHGGPSIELNRGTGSGSNLPLGNFDPTTLENGAYQLIVEAVDTSGRTSFSGAEVLIEGNMKLGQFSLSFEDVNVPVEGIPVTLTRTYDTRVRGRNMDFGYGWSADYQTVRIRESRTLGKSWRNDRPFGTLNNCIKANGVPMVSVTLPDGRTENFKPKLSKECHLVVILPVELQFVPEGIDHGYKLEQLNYSLVEWRGDGLYEPGFQEPVDPSIYKLTTPDGTEYLIDQAFGIRTIKDTLGNTLTYSDAGVVHSSGVRLDFVRDAQGRITEVVQPDGQRYRYIYDESGDLRQMIDPVNGTVYPTAFEYLPGKHYLTRITGPNGFSTRNEFDDDGRLVRTIDALGKVIEFNRVLQDRTETVKDRLGREITYIYDERGNVLSERNALGQITLRTYDNDDNVLTETNPLGETVTRTYDNFRNTLTETNHLGETTTMTYDQRQNLASSRNPLGHTHTTEYDYRTNTLRKMTDAMGARTELYYTIINTRAEYMTDGLGQRTSWTYDSRGRKDSETDPSGAVTRWTHDTMGRVLTESKSRIGANGQLLEMVTAYTYDHKGRLIKTRAPDGSGTQTTYTSTDKVSKQIDALGRATSFSYDQLDRLTRITYPDGTYEATTYDAEGRELSKRDRLGRITEMKYDVLGRVIETIYPDTTPTNSNDNPRTRTVYDAAGRVSESYDERNNRTTYEYDGAGRQTAVINALGQRTETTYDAAGRRIAVRDANGHVSKFEYDAAGRLLKTVQPDETTATDADNPVMAMRYDLLGRKLETIDPATRRTRFEFDAVGRLNAVIDSLNQRTEYGYDAQGNRITQKDARGNVTKFGFDGMNRQISRELPLGMREGMRYDEQGRLVEKIDFNGRSTTHQYDVNDRLSQINHADGRITLFQYDANGQRTRSEQRYPNGAIEITTYAYDERNRLKEVVYPDASFVRYAYDQAGNRTQVITPSATINYGFDVLNRLSSVAAPEGTSTYAYDAAGNRASETKPNGVTTTYTYNPRNQLVHMAHKAAAGALLLGLNYTLDASGMRQRIEEFAGASEAAAELRTTRAYSYDPLMRLTAETVTCGAGNTLCAPRTTTWTYDAVGNRQIQIETRAAGIATTSYVYDANDRLLSSTLSGVPGNGDTLGSTVNRYDANGNLIESNEPGESGQKRTVYGWDSDDKLVSASITQSENGSPTTTESRYTYNADGIRRTQTANFGTPDATTIQYLIDPNQAYAQVLEETVRPATQSGAGQLVVRYSYGDDLLAQVRTGVEAPNVGSASGVSDSGEVTNFYHYDGLGTTRLLSDAAGTVTDQYGFEAFGGKDQAASAGATANNYLYAGDQYDLGLKSYYLRARYVDYNTGRFLSADEFAGSVNHPMSLHKYTYAHNSPTMATDPSGYSVLGTVSGLVFNASIRIVSLGLRFVPIARSLQIAIGSVPAMSYYGPRVQAFFQGTGLKGMQMLQTSIYQVVRGVNVGAAHLQQSLNMTTSYTPRLNQLFGVQAQSLGYQYHKLLEASYRLPANITYSIGNIVPTPQAVHQAISNVHSTAISPGGQTLRTYIGNLIGNGNLSVEAAYLAEARIWELGMRLNGAAIPVGNALSIVDEVL